MVIGRLCQHVDSWKTMYDVVWFEKKRLYKKTGEYVLQTNSRYL